MITMDKKYRTRGGRDVRLLCTDRPVRSSVVGLVGAGVLTWPADGRFPDDRDFDLIEVVPDVVFYRNIFSRRTGLQYVSIAKCRSAAIRQHEKPIAVMRTTIRNGGKSRSDVTVEVLPVDYVEQTP